MNRSSSAGCWNEFIESYFSRLALSGVMALVEQVWLVAVCRRSAACYAVQRHNSINDYL